MTLSFAYSWAEADWKKFFSQLITLALKFRTHPFLHLGRQFYLLVLGGCYS